MLHACKLLLPGYSSSVKHPNKLLCQGKGCKAHLQYETAENPPGRQFLSAAEESSMNLLVLGSAKCYFTFPDVS